MNDPIVHTILDANILAAWLVPSSINRPEVQVRAANLIESRIEHYWPSIRLYVPGIVAAETQAVLDKYRLCTWTGPIKKDPSRRVTQGAYLRAQSRLNELMQSRRIERLDHQADHVLATQLVSPVNASYQFRRRRTTTTVPATKKLIPQPMGAADCLIIGTAISLGMRLGSENVVIATADPRLADVVRKLRKMKFKKAHELRLDAVARRLGTVWTPQLYPRCVNLRSATPQELAQAFQAWPLPTGQWVPALDETFLKLQHEEKLIEIYKRHKSATRLGVDKLPYTPEIDAIRIDMVNETELLLSNSLIYLLLSKWRKGGRFKEQ